MGRINQRMLYEYVVVGETRCGKTTISNAILNARYSVEPFRLPRNKKLLKCTRFRNNKDVSVVDTSAIPSDWDLTNAIRELELAGLSKSDMWTMVVIFRDTVRWRGFLEHLKRTFDISAERCIVIVTHCKNSRLRKKAESDEELLALLDSGHRCIGIDLYSNEIIKVLYDVPEKYVKKLERHHQIENMLNLIGC